MKVVILAGGFGTRLSEETSLKPKPMVEIGNMPILWHIMKSYLQAKKNALDEGLKLFLEFKEIEDDKVRAILFLYLFQQIINT